MAKAWPLLLPLTVLYGAMVLLPLGITLYLSVADGGAHYAAVLQSRLLLRVAQNTVVISLITTVVALLLGYLLAAALWRARPAQRSLLLAFILLPFWTGVLIKNFAWASLLQDNGAINTLLHGAGHHQRPDDAAAQPPGRHHRHGALRAALRGVPDLHRDAGRSIGGWSRRHAASGARAARGVAHHPAADAARRDQRRAAGVHRLLRLLHHAGDPRRAVRHDGREPGRLLRARRRGLQLRRRAGGADPARRRCR